MSLFAKVFIAVNALLTLALTFLMATLLAQKSDYKAQFHMVFKQDQRAGEDLETRTKDFDSLTRLNRQENARKRNHAANLERTLTDTRGVVKSQGAALSKLRSEVSQLDSQWNALQSRWNKLKKLRSDLQRDTNLARIERDKAVENRRQLKNTRSSVDGEILKLQEKVNDLTKLVIDRGTATQKLVLLVDMIKERHPDLDIPEPTPQLDGKVKAISGDLVTLTLGRDAGVELGFAFTVIRGKVYIGRVVVNRVHKLTCIARIDKAMLAEGRKISVGDVVTTNK